jgi:hypothetical protein
MSSAPQTKVLTEMLREVIGKRAVRAAVFTTFTFEPKFFELQVLPALFDRAWAREDNVRRAQVEEELAKVDHVAVYYDRKVFDGGQAGLDYRRFGVARKTGYFHAKHVLILVDGPPAALLVVTLSANLSQAGWWENVETAHVHAIEEGVPCALREGLLDNGGSPGLLRRLREHDRTGERHDAVDAIGDFLRQRVPPGRTSGDPVLWVGRTPFADFLAEHRTPGCRMEVIAPYLEAVSEPTVLANLIGKVNPAQTRVFLPLDRKQAAAAQADYLAAVPKLKNVAWADLDGKVTAWSRKDDGARRFVHAKVYRLFHGKSETLVVGSVNLTAAAHGDARSGNFETAVLVHLTHPKPADWWMAPRTDMPPPGRVEDGEEGTPRPFAPPIHLRFDWSSSALDYFYEADAAPRTIEIQAGFPLATITSPRVGAWVRVEADGDAVRARLQNTAIVTVSVDGQDFAPVLVREDNMKDKPSYVMTLTAEQILIFWSLLTNEQRDDFLARHGRRPTLPDGEVTTTPATPDDDAGDSMFDRFAGIFHGFSCMVDHVSASLAAGREKEANYRILGTKHDSLRALVDRVANDASSDPVNRYVSILCAKQALASAEVAGPDWAKSNAGEILAARQAIESAAAIRDSLDLGPPDERARFLSWFEGHFLRSASVPA